MNLGRDLRIGQRFLLVGLLPAIVLALAITGYLTVDRLRDADQRFNAHGAALSRELAAAAVYGLFVGDNVFLEEMAESFQRRNHHVLRIDVQDTEGNVVVSLAKPEESVSSSRRNRPYPVFEHEVRPPFIALDPEEQAAGTSTERILGKVRLTLDTTEITTGFEQIMRNSLAILVFGLILFALWLRATSRRISQPIEQVVETIRRVRENKLDTRVSVQSSGELRVLEEGINEMVSALAIQQDELERQITNATEELRTTMEELEVRNIEFDLARKEAIRANRVKSQFLAHMSHEIRTPMNGILGFVGLLKRTALNTFQRDQLATIERSARDLLAIINDILDFSKIESGKLKLTRDPFELRKLLFDTASLFAPLAAEKRIELVATVDEDVADAVIGDAMRLRQILVNLLSNAVKFTDSGHVALRLGMKRNPSGRFCRLLLTVEDSGIGIPVNELQDLFDAFHQADSARSHFVQGTGLGLAITKSLVEAMDGTIEVKSTEGNGTVFSAAIELELAHPEAPFVSAVANGRRALISDPVDVSRRALAQLLRQHGIQVVELTAEDPLPGEPADLVFVGIPAGPESELSADMQLAPWRNAAARIVVYGPSPDAAQDEDFIKAGASAYLVKPVSPAALGPLIKQGEKIPASVSLGAQTPAVPQHCGCLAGRRFLVADDNAINRRLVAQLLGNQEGQVVEATTGAEALAAARDDDFDVIFLDLHMPVMSGIQAAEEIRRLPQHVGTVIAALTADALPESGAQARRAHIDHVLIKPIDADELLSLVLQWLHISCNATDHDLRDTDAALRIAGGSRELADELFKQFRNELPQQMETLKTLLHERDMESAREMLHQVKGAAAICALTGLVPELDRLREAVVDENQDRINERFESLCQLASSLSGSVAESPASVRAPALPS